MPRETWTLGDVTRPLPLQLATPTRLSPQARTSNGGWADAGLSTSPTRVYGSHSRVSFLPLPTSHTPGSERVIEHLGPPSDPQPLQTTAVSPLAMWCSLHLLPHALTGRLSGASSSLDRPPETNQSELDAKFPVFRISIHHRMHGTGSTVHPFPLCDNRPYPASRGADPNGHKGVRGLQWHNMLVYPI